MALPQSILDDLNSFASGRREWSHWPNWFAMYASSLARELSPSHMKWLKLQRADGKLLHNWVERSSWELYQRLTNLAAINSNQQCPER